MRSLWSKFLGRFPLAILAGLLLAASFPKIGIAGFAWVAPGLVCLAAIGTTGGESFRIGYMAGLTHYLASLYWLLLIPYRWHGIPLGPAAGWLTLSGFLALYPATWVWLMCRKRKPGETTLESPASGWLGAFGQNALPATWAGRSLWALSGAAGWVAFEMVLARFLGGFPWNLLGASQYQMIPLIQVCSVTGIYGISFLIVWTSLSLMSGGIVVCRESVRRSAWVPEVILPMLAVAITFNLGFRQLRAEAPSARTVKLTLVQPSIPQTLIWDSARDEERFHELLNLSEKALSNATDVLVWPEAAVPKLLRYDKETFEAVTGLARRFHVWMIIGADDAEPRLGSSKPNDADYFNGSFLINPEGRLVGSYRKRSLVIFGEFIPFQRWMPFLKYFTPIESGYTPGDRSVQFHLSNPAVKTSVLICFEDTFPQLARADVKEDTDFLVNLTNNGWFGEGAAQWQHATSALFRAVETGVPLIRCTNNGLTCWADAHGRLREIFRDERGTIYGPGFLTAEVPLPAVGTRHPVTFYGRYGDWFGWTCVGVGVLLGVRRLLPG